MIRELAKSPIKICFIVGIFDGRVSIYIYIYIRKGGGGVLSTGTSRKMGVLRTGHVKKTILVTAVAQKGVLGAAYLLITLTFFLST